MKQRLTRKQVAPRNLAAKALRQARFQPKVAENPEAYSRKQKHRTKPGAEDHALPPEPDDASIPKAPEAYRQQP